MTILIWDQVQIFSLIQFLASRGLAIIGFPPLQVIFKSLKILPSKSPNDSHNMHLNNTQKRINFEIINTYYNYLELLIIIISFCLSTSLQRFN